MHLGHEPGRATCLVVKCPDDELGTQLRRLWRGKFQPQHNVRECAPDSQMPKGGVSEEHFRHASTGKTTEHIATCKVVHGDVNAHHDLEFGQTMVKWFMKIWHSSFYDTFSKPMAIIVLCGKMLYNQKMIYDRMIVLMSSNRSVPIDTCMITDVVFQ